MRWRTVGIIACLDLFLWACASNPNPPSPNAVLSLSANDVIRDSYHPDFDPIVMDEWGEEAYERFGAGTVVVGCHGWYAINGDWYVFPIELNPADALDRPWPVENLIKYEQAAHPGHKIVLLCCNVDHVVLHGFKNVFYSPADVWLVPDAYAPLAERLRRAMVDHEPSGDIDKFIEAK